MKRLIIIRHAKSSWKHNVIDHERPLNTRGLSDCELISSQLFVENEVDLVFVSDAMRTKITSEIFLKKASYNYGKVIHKHSLYDFSGEQLTEEIKNCDDDVKTLMVFGHNHAITSFVNTYGDKYIDNVPTCGVTIIDFDTDNWKDIQEGTTVKTIFPRDFK